jgi:hypothetical protein
MRKPKDLILSSDQRAIVSMDEIILLFDHRKLNAKSAKKLAKWLVNASEYLKSKKVENPKGFIV